jgi:hypothetical protein
MNLDAARLPIEVLAADWLTSEERAVAESSELTASLATEASKRFEEAVREATREDLRLAWEAAKANQADCEMGSKAWADARSVSHLLRVEFLASGDRREDWRADSDSRITPTAAGRRATRRR